MNKILCVYTIFFATFLAIVLSIPVEVQIVEIDSTNQNDTSKYEYNAVEEVRTTTKKPPPSIKSYTESDNPDGGHTFKYILTDFQVREETVQILNRGTDEEELVIFGYYSFRGDDGFKYTVHYRGDRNGYNATVDKVSTKRIQPGLIKSLVG